MAEIGIKLADGAFFPVLPDETQQRKRLVLSAAQPKEGTVHIDLHRREGGQETYIGSLALQDLDPSEEVEFELRMEIDANGDLDVFIHDGGRTQYQSLSIPLRDLENPTLSSPFSDDEADDEGFSQIFPTESLDDSDDSEAESELDESDISDIDLEQELLDDEDAPAEETAPDLDEFALEDDDLGLGESFDLPPAEEPVAEEEFNLDDFDLDEGAEDVLSEDLESDDDVNLDGFVLGGDLDADLESSMSSNPDADEDLGQDHTNENPLEPIAEDFIEEDLGDEGFDDADFDDGDLDDGDLDDGDSSLDELELEQATTDSGAYTDDTPDIPEKQAEPAKKKKEKPPKARKPASSAPTRPYHNTPASSRPVNPVVMAALILVVVSLLALGAWLVLLLQNAQVMPELRASHIIPMVWLPHRQLKRRIR